MLVIISILSFANEIYRRDKLRSRDQRRFLFVEKVNTSRIYEGSASLYVQQNLGKKIISMNI